MLGKKRAMPHKKNVRNSRGPDFYRWLNERKTMPIGIAQITAVLS
jgi:hypothetical protein